VRVNFGDPKSFTGPKRTGQEIKREGVLNGERKGLSRSLTERAVEPGPDVAAFWPGVLRRK